MPESMEERLTENSVNPAESTETSDTPAEAAESAPEPEHGSAAEASPALEPEAADTSPATEPETPDTVTPQAETAGSEPAGSDETESDDAETIGAAEMEELIEQYSGDAAPSRGEVRAGTVVNITGDGVVVDLGLKSEGLVPRGEFSDENGQPTIEAGAEIEVLVEGSQVRDGYLPCSSEGAHRLKLWDEVEQACRDKTKVRCQVGQRVKGGYEVEINLPGAHPGRRPLTGFMPGSQVDLKPVRYWEGFLGRQLDCRVLRLNRRRGNIVVSRRHLLEEEQEKKRKLLDEVLHEGAEITGTVKNLTDFGAFIDLGGLDGLLHVTDISYRRIKKPSEALSVGDEVRVKVLKIDKAKERISLGMKQLEPDPWEGAGQKYPVGERVRGRVSHLRDYGAFVELEPGLEGLIHVSEMSWTKRVRHPKDLLKRGDWVEAVVLDFQPREQRISLGLRQTQPDPFETVAERYPVGSVGRGVVRSLTDFGAFIELEPGVEGLVHKTEIAWDKIKKPSDVLKRGEEVQAKVLRVDKAERRISLSIRNLTPDPWADYVRSVSVGSVVRGKVVRRTGFGVFVELAPGVEGLCHVSELGEESEESKVEAGQEHEWHVIKLTPSERRLGLSLKREAEQRALEKLRAQSRPSTSLGEILAAKGQRAGLRKS